MCEFAGETPFFLVIHLFLSGQFQPNGCGSKPASNEDSVGVSSQTIVRSNTALSRSRFGWPTKAALASLPRAAGVGPCAASGSASRSNRDMNGSMFMGRWKCWQATPSFVSCPLGQSGFQPGFSPADCRQRSHRRACGHSGSGGLSPAPGRCGPARPDSSVALAALQSRTQSDRRPLGPGAGCDL